MNSYIEMDILNELEKMEFCKSSELCQKLQIGEKVLRSAIGMINSKLRKDVAEIESKRGKGYRLVILKHDEYARQKEQFYENKKGGIPESSAERVEFLVLFLLGQQGYVKREYLSEFLYVSEKTISADLKTVEYILAQYDILIERKAHYGMKAVGEEFSKRQCIVNHYLNENGMWLINRTEIQEMMQKIGEIVLKVFKEYELYIGEIQLKSLVDYLYILHHRTKRGFVIKNVCSENLEDKNVYNVLEKILLTMKKDNFKVEVTRAEVDYLSLYLSGNGVSHLELNGTANIKISEEIMRLTDEMLQCIYEIYGIDFRNNFDLQMYMNKHIYALKIRLQYRIALHNPLLAQVKEKYLYEYMMAEQACTIITREYNKKLSEDEIAYFALLFASERKFHIEEARKKNVLLVCATGKTSSRYLQMILKQRFEGYINRLDLCSVYELKNQELRQYDCIFSTVPIDVSIPMPIVIMHEFLNQSEVSEVKKILKDYDFQILNRYFDERLFFKEVEGSTKEEVIYDLCNRLGKIRRIPDKFYESVLERERLGSTDFGNLVAIPHPNEKLSEEDIVCIGILPNPIKWERNLVQIVIMSAISEGMSEESRLFYKVISALIMNKNFVDNIIREKSFDELVKCINQLVYIVE